MQQNLNKRFFSIGTMLSIPVAVILFYLTSHFGMKQAFLMLNGDGGVAADYFFRFFTNFGDAALWVPMLGYLLWKKKKNILPLVISTFAVGTILVQVCKYLIVPDEPRPTTFITDGSYIHTVPGVTVHSISSFPSGHTATAFGFFLLICLMTTKNWWLPVGFLMACLVGYSRIYLAQHFPLDVAAGIIAGFISVLLSIPVQNYFDKRRTQTIP